MNKPKAYINPEIAKTIAAWVFEDDDEKDYSWNDLFKITKMLNALKNLEEAFIKSPDYDYKLMFDFFDEEE